MHVVKILIVGTISFIFGFGLLACENSGNAQEWKKLSTPPQNVSELIPTGNPPFFIKTSEGKIYRYSDWHNEGWIQESGAQNPINPFDVTKPCDFSRPEFSPFSNAPKSIKECFQETTRYADGYIKYAIVIDNNGNIWEWRSVETAGDMTPIFCSLSGLPVGLVVAFAFVSRKINK